MESAETDALTHLDFPPGTAAAYARTTCTDNSNLPGVTRLSFRT